jgi:hypothetical protein
MTGVSGALSTGLPDEVQRLLATPPVTEKKLLELSVAWTGLAPGQARMARALRLFVITWDPLEWHAPRPYGFATANGDPTDFELVVYTPIWSLVELATTSQNTVAAVLGAMAGSAVLTAVAGAQAGDLVAGPAMPDLLGDPAAGAALGSCDVRLASAGWEDIGLGAVTDIVQHAYGPVDLDRSPVELAAAARPHPSCRACAGVRFDFPADLAEARDGLCPAHRSQADTVIRSRLARASASNPDGWGALTDASGRLELPHLPGGLATKLAGAGEAMYVMPEPGELAVRAQLVVDAAGWFPGRARELAIALGEEPELAGLLPDWLVTLVLDLGRAGLGAEAAMVGDALAQVDPDRRALYDGDTAVALAQAGLAEQARAKIEANLARWPDDVWIRVHAGDALAALGDAAGAEGHFAAALEMAEAADDFEARSDALMRLRQVGHDERPDVRQPTGQRRQPKRKRSRSRRRRKR